MNNPLVWNALLFILYVSIQVALFGQLKPLLGVASCFVYLNFILSFPRETNSTVLIGLGFLIGLTVDIFLFTWGIHSGACVLVAFLRPYVLDFFTQKEKSIGVSAKEMGFVNFSLFLVLMIFLHHNIVLFLESGAFSYSGLLLIKILSSTLYTFTIIMIFHFLFFSQTQKQTSL